MNNTICNLVKFFAGALIVFGLSGNAALANNNCDSDSMTFSTSIGATTSCANYNMSGCIIGAGGTECSFGDESCGFTVIANPGVGQSGDKSTTYSLGLGSVTGGCRPRVAITQGNQGASYCSYFYPDGIEDGGDSLDTTSKQGSGKAIAHKQLEICTDGQVQAPTLSPPVISLEKTVGREEEDGSFNCTNAFDEISVIAGDPSTNGTEVIYCYTVRNDGLSPIDGLVIKDDFGTPGFETLDVECIDILGEAVTSLAYTDSCVAKSEPVTIPNTVELVVNTAMVEGTFNSEPTPCPTCTDSDTATVNVVVQCDADTQQEADDTDTVVERRGLLGTTRCGPRADDTVDQGVGLLCDGTCELKPDCAATTGVLPAHCVQPCKPSGNWNTFDDDGNPVEGDPSPGNLPRCQEVLTNPGNDPPSLGVGGTVTEPSFLRSDGHSAAFRQNPFLYYFPASGGGNSVGTIYCILYPGETSADCPTGSIVY